jgi:flagellar biosynthesis protein FlhF
MQVKRFVAADMRRALEMVRQELGPDAIILSSNRIPEGVELLTTMGSDYELQQLQNRPFGDATFSPSEPLLTDGDISPRVLDNVQPHNTQSRSAQSRNAQPRKAIPVINQVADHPNAGKTGAQLADDIEKARLRMIAAQQAEESAKEFLVGKNTIVNAGIPRNAATPESKPRVGMSAAERYPLIDPAPASNPKLSPESLSFRDALMKEARAKKEAGLKDNFIEELKQEKRSGLAESFAIEQDYPTCRPKSPTCACCWSSSWIG